MTAQPHSLLGAASLGISLGLETIRSGGREKDTLCNDGSVAVGLFDVGMLKSSSTTSFPPQEEITVVP